MIQQLHCWAFIPQNDDHTPTKTSMHIFYSRGLQPPGLLGTRPHSRRCKASPAAPHHCITAWTPPLDPVKKLSSMKPDPDDKKVGNPFYSFICNNWNL